ncbi:MAG: 3-oxoacyl-[acyl-carrier-protein] reductase FabG [Acidimicrobiales bacterium]|nr:MAG: glucose 1-dehydrogenase [Actinomycetota bacterium]MBV6508113.1 3-oxoacyl-[acyl-carrier-protein] reductase FabG [Acidimicrobiales bacterium]RIK03859.1 MAG: oxidoreductase [Acidobacteriota bacterium]
MGSEGRVALVTGGGRGVGRAISLALAEDGADVAVNYRQDAEAAASTVSEIEKLGRRSLAYQSDVGEPASDHRLVERVVADFGFVDILVNNAGIASRGHSVENTDPEELERVMRIHALGPHHLCQAVLPGMRERERGDIVMISSVASRSLAANGGPYNMAKAAMEALAGTLAKEEARNRIHVNVVAPGLVETEMGRRLMKAVAGIEDIRALDRVMPFGRVCRPEDVAEVVRFLVSERAGYVTGQTVFVDGGAPV